MFPAKLNNRSEGMEVAGMQSSLRAIEDSLGYLWLLRLHHLRESFKSGTTCSALYVATSVSASLVSSGEDPLLSLVTTLSVVFLCNSNRSTNVCERGIYG